MVDPPNRTPPWLNWVLVAVVLVALLWLLAALAFPEGSFGVPG